MYLIYDNSINRHIGQAEELFDVTQISPNYELVTPTIEKELDFEEYKLEEATKNTTELIDTLMADGADEEVIDEIRLEFEDYLDDIEDQLLEFIASEEVIPV